VKAAELKFGPGLREADDGRSTCSRVGFGTTPSRRRLGASRSRGSSTACRRWWRSSTRRPRAARRSSSSSSRSFNRSSTASAGAIPSVERLFLHAEILALKAYISLKPYSRRDHGRRQGASSSPRRLIVGVRRRRDRWIRRQHRRRRSRWSRRSSSTVILIERAHRRAQGGRRSDRGLRVWRR
jgi:hypothetical protein